MYVSWTLANFGGGQTIPAYCCNQVAGASKTGSSWPRLTLGARPTTSRSRSRLLPPGVQLYSSQHDLGSSTSNSRLRRWKRSTRCRTVCGSTNDIDGEPAAGVRRVRHVATSLFSGATSPTSGNTNAGDHSVEEDANKKSTNATGSVDRTRLPPRRDVEDAHRVFALGKRLHLRRHRSRVARDTALRLFRESMRLRPDWRETDARFAVDSGIDSVFKTFSCSSGDRNTKSQRSTVGSNTSNSTADTKGHDGVRCYDGSKPSRRSGNCGEQAWGDIAVRNAVVCLRATLAGIGYTAWRVQERFGRAAGPAHGQRLPGPYYLRKSLDHTHASMVASLGPPRDGLDVAIRIFLLGLALPRTDVEYSLGSEAIDSLNALGMLGECPVDPSLLTSLVQLFPLDADALSAPSEDLVGDSNNRVAIAGHGDRQGYTEGDEDKEIEEAEDRSVAVVLGAGVDGAQAPAFAAGASTRGTIARASDLIFATDWPPPGSTALTEEPVMYIGPDSIGLVQHAPRPVSSSKIPPSSAEKREPDSCQQGGPRGAETIVRENEEGWETILDLCCGSGVQGIAAAALRRGKARVTCVDINPRAVRFARFNALLNGLGDASFNAVAGDLYCALERGGSHDDGDSVSRAMSQRDGETRQGAAAVEEGSNDPQYDTMPTSNGGDVLFDLILANPPFVPVPPKLDSVRRRYDVFASGGASGEDVIEGIFRGAIDHLRPSGGVLAVVSELANPRTFDVKLRSWVGAHDDRLAVASTEPAVGKPQEAEGGDVDGENNQREQMNTPAAIDMRTTSRQQGADGSQKFSSGGFGEEAKACVAWTGLVMHEEEPWTAREYAGRRAGSAQEVEGWVRHLSRMGIEEMANGFVFVRRIPRAAPEGRGLDIKDEEGLERTRAAVEIQGVEKLWAPHNRAAVERTNASLRRM